MDDNKIALFIDADNISPKHGKFIINALIGKGSILIRRIYGNWQKVNLQSWNDFIISYGILPVHQIDFTSGKNASDMALTIDAMDFLHQNLANVFVIVSNDSDFTPLAVRLRERGVKVIGMGIEQVSHSFRAACSEFIDLSKFESQSQSASTLALPKPTKKKTANKASSMQQVLSFQESETPTEKPPVSNPPVKPSLPSAKDLRLQQIHNVFAQATKNFADNSGFTDLSRAGNLLREKNLGFGVKDFGHSTLKKFVASYPSFYEIKMINGACRYKVKKPA